MSYEAARQSEAEDQRLYTHLEARALEDKARRDRNGDPDYPVFLLRRWCAARAVITAMVSQEPGVLITYTTDTGGTYSLPARVLCHEWRLGEFIE